MLARGHTARAYGQMCCSYPPWSCRLPVLALLARHSAAPLRWAAAKGCGPQKLCSVPIHVLPSMTIGPSGVRSVVDAQSRSSLQPAADHIWSNCSMPLGSSDLAFNRAALWPPRIFSSASRWLCILSVKSSLVELALCFHRGLRPTARRRSCRLPSPQPCRSRSNP